MIFLNFSKKIFSSKLVSSGPIWRPCVRSSKLANLESDRTWNIRVMTQNVTNSVNFDLALRHQFFFEFVSLWLFWMSLRLAFERCITRFSSCFRLRDMAVWKMGFWSTDLKHQTHVYLSTARIELEYNSTTTQPIWMSDGLSERYLACAETFF